MRPRIAVGWVLMVALGLFAAAPAEASAIKISDGDRELLITDQDFIPGTDNPPDFSTDSGVVSFIGSLGAWSFTLTSGTTKPEVGSPTNPILQLSNLSISSAGGGTLTIWFSEVGFGPTGSTAESWIGGATSGTVTYETFKGSNTLFQPSTTLASMSFNSGGFSSASSNVFEGSSGPYSLSQKVTITHGSGLQATALQASLTVTSAASSSSVPDGGMTLSLLGLGLVGIAGVQRKLSRSNDNG